MAYRAEPQVIVLEDGGQIWIEPVDEPDRRLRMTMLDENGAAL